MDEGILDILAGAPSGSDDGLQVPRAWSTDIVEVDGDLELVASQAAPRERKFVQRSWELMRVAQAAKRQRQVEAKLEKAVAAKQLVESQLDAVVCMYPLVAMSLGLKGSRVATEMDEKKARLTCAIAVRRLVRGPDSVRHTQSRSLWLTARTALNLQAGHSQKRPVRGKGCGRLARGRGSGRSRGRTACRGHHARVAMGRGYPEVQELASRGELWRTHGLRGCGGAGHDAGWPSACLRCRR